MFGYMIIKKDDYNRLSNAEMVFQKSLDEVREELQKAEKDLYSLRQQNGELRNTVNVRGQELEKQACKIKELKSVNTKLRQFKSEVMDVFGEINFHSFRPIPCTCQCDKCDHEQSDCKKYTFGDATFCMVGK